MRSAQFRPLRHRAVRLIWGASIVSDIGTWVQLVVIGSLVARESGSALQTGLVALATFVPQGLTAPVGGLLADRHDRRRLFMIGLAGQGLATGGLAVALAAGVRRPETLIVLILLSSSFGSFGAPAYSAMVPDLVPPDELMPMVSLGILSWNGGRIVGPMLGTVLAAAIGPAWAITFNAITFFALTLAVWAVRRPFRPAAGTDSGTVTQRMKVGWHALRSTSGCWHGWYLVLLINFSIAPFMALIPIYANRVFSGGTALTGLFSTVQGAGAIVGTLATTSAAARYGAARPLSVAVPGGVVVYATWAAAPNTAVACVVVVFLGAAVAALFVTAMSMIQRDAPAEQRGRVMSIAQASMGLGYGVGILWVGAVGDAVNLRAAFALAALSFAVGFVVLQIRSPQWRQAVDGAALQLTTA